ncbi:MAG TPA: MiaB/RimO family radical SAM methylthiotransferase [Candidatus Absconditabacterales bacterium]|nr:MiaB/RimO family radical SAM methylthiotransferase [Candidatus Absconditabacterales bacterium]
MDYKIFGCKVNKYYLNKRLNYFSSENSPLGREKQGVKSGNFIIASCVVTDKAKNKFIKETIKQVENGKHVYLTGCAVFDKGAKMNDDRFYSIYPELKKFKKNITLLGEEPDKKSTSPLIKGESKGDLKTANIYTKKFIVIQNGCDNYCSFCLTINKRGKSKNIPANEIIQEINDFVSIGGKEIVITGINLAARGCTNTKKPQDSKFAELLQQILDETKIERIRISSLGPEFLNDKFFEVIKNPRFLPHFHLSIQSFSDKILKSMNRHYDSQILDNVINRLKNLDRPDKKQISIGADIIVGFPGETEEDFQKTIDGISKHKINKVHAFPFSSHEKGETIPAHGLPDQILQEIKKRREKELKKITDQIREDFIKANKGLEHEILVEEQKNGKRRGWTGNYIQVELEGNYTKGTIEKIIL